MNNENAVQQDNAGKFRPFDISKVKVGDEVWFLAGARTTGRIIDIDLKAGYEAVVVRWATGTVSTYCVEGRPFSGAGVFLALPPLDPLDEVDPSPGNVDKLTRRQVGEGYRIPAHDEEPDPRAEFWWRRTWDPDCTPRAGGRYKRGSTYRVPIAPAMGPLEQSDIVLGKTVVRAKGGSGEFLVIAKRPEGFWPAGRTGEACVTWTELREVYDVSFDHGATWQKAEKKGKEPTR